MSDTSQTVLGHRGARLTLFDALWVAAGQFQGSGFESRATGGVGVSVRNALYAFGVLSDDAELVALGRRPFDVRYTLAAQFENDTFPTTLAHTVTLAWRGW